MRWQRKIHDISNMIQVKAKGKNLKLEFFVDPKIPSKLMGDDVRIRQILVNLLNNAVKYTKEGSIRLRVEAQEEEHKVLLHFSVEDTGIGIKQEDISKLFQEFQRIEEKRNRNIEGTGLGLNITARFLALMGSSLKVESVYGKGSRFYFTLEQQVVDSTPIGNLQERIRQQVTEYHYSAVFTAPEEKSTVKKTIEKKESCLGEGQDHGFGKNLDGSKREDCDNEVFDLGEREQGDWKLPKIEGIDWGCAKKHLPTKELLLSTIKDFYKTMHTEADLLEEFYERIKNKEESAFNSYRIKVHSMKSSANLIGATVLGEMAKTLEDGARKEEESVLEALHPIFLPKWCSYDKVLKELVEEVTEKKREKGERIEEDDKRWEEILESLTLLKEALEKKEQGEKCGVLKEEEAAKKRILAVDDSGILLRSVKAALENTYEVMVANSGMMAIKQAKKKLPDLILLDYEMPEWDGRKTLEEIRKDEELKDIPVVFLTAVREREHIAAVLKLRPSGYLLKPIEPQILIDSIEKAMVRI